NGGDETPADIYLYDRQTNSYTWVSSPERVASAHGVSNPLPSGETYQGIPSVSADGRYVVYQGHYQVTDQFGTHSESEIYLFDRITNQTALVPGLAGEPKLNGNGSLLVATGDHNFGQNPPPAGGGYNDVLLVDRLGNVLARIAADNGLSPINSPDISNDG